MGDKTWDIVHKWSAKRSRNLQRLCKEVFKKDSVYLEMTKSFLEAQGKYLAAVGDEAGSMLCAALVIATHNRIMVPKRKKKPARRHKPT